MENNKVEENVIKDDRKTINIDLLDIPESYLEEAKEMETENPRDVDVYMAKSKMGMYQQLFKVYGESSKGDLRLKKIFSTILLVILVIQLIALDVIFILNGAKVLEFNDTTFNIFITTGIAEVFALVTIIVKYLFSDNLTKLLSIIINSDNKE